MHSYRVAVVGAGYVGLTTAACFASLGHHVKCADVDAAKLVELRRGEVRILEPGLPELVAEGIASGRLEFIDGAAGAVTDAEVVFLCLPTPMGEGGLADLTAVDSVLAEIRDLLPKDVVLVNKSTVPVGTAERTQALLGRDDVAVVSNPEFLREGSGVADFLRPDRIVVGATEREAAERVSALYARVGAATVLTDVASAEMVKYAANCFLAMKLSYVNSLAELCERLGADISDVTEGMGRDSRIGPAFLRPGPGWGGSCLPKDTNALLRVADAAGFDFAILRSVIDTNSRQAARVVGKIAEACGREPDARLDGVRLGLLGLTFKSGTNDLRDSPALAVARVLSERGAELVAYDPGMQSFEQPVTAELIEAAELMTIVDDSEQAAKGAAALVLLTEWPVFRTLEWARLAELLAGPVVVDTRNHLDRDVLAKAGITWHGIGHPQLRPVEPLKKG